MKEIFADYRSQLHNQHYDGLCVTINTVTNKHRGLVMGGGVARIFAEEFDDAPFRFARILDDTKVKNRSEVAAYYDDEFDRYMIGVITKHDYKDPSWMWLVKESCLSLVRFANMVGLKSVLLPRPGCGLGGLDWDTQVKPMLEEINLDDRFHIIHYELRQTK